VFDKVIVGVDGLSGGRDAVVLAKELAGNVDEIALAHVFIESLLPAHGSPGVFQAGEREHSRELLQAARSESGLDAKLYPVASYFVGRGLHELAERLGSDLIVVGSSHRGLIGRVFQGDDMRAALNGAPCAVAVAPSGYAERSSILAEIGVGYDGSPGSQHALSVARELAAEHGARVSAFEAVSPPPRTIAGARHPDQATLDAEVQEARERLAALADVEPHAAYGEPAEELALYGASVDLLIVGSRGYGPLGRLVHGRTSLQLARSARCPLLVLPRAAPNDGPSSVPQG
jgi:nucleotide-binding universal stress UspA family protein